MEKVDVLEQLKSMGLEKVCYCPNPGNAGDSAIALGAYSLFDQAKISYETVHWNEDFEEAGKTVIYGGGGNLRDPYSNARTFIERHHSEAERFIIFPHTIQGHKKLLHRLGYNVEIFCRDIRSYKMVMKNASGPNVHLSDDLAFRIDAHDILERHSPSEVGLIQRIGYGIWDSALRRIGVGGQNCSDLRISGRLGTVAFYQLVSSFMSQKSTLYALRTDVEKTNQTRPIGNVDVSRVFEYGVAPRSKALQATVFILAYLDRFDRIVTNRLHVAILAGLLNKEVDFYPNNDFKNKEVYKLSIKGQFPNVRWHGG
jgi:exopolysaccharide biosynthesis predicted pyruvyltransferase EpsI